MTFRSNHYLKKSLNSLKTLNERFLALDSSLFSAKQRQLMDKMSLTERRKLKKEILDKQQKVGLESEIEELETRIENREIVINQSLRECGVLMVICGELFFMRSKEECMIYKFCGSFNPDNDLIHVVIHASFLH